MRKSVREVDLGAEEEEDMVLFFLFLLLLTFLLRKVDQDVEERYYHISMAAYVAKYN